MRITFNMQAARYTEALTNSLSAIDEAQRKVNSKKNLINPEDDPSRYVAAYSVQRMLDEIEQFGKNASNASSWLKNADNELQQALTLLKTARDDLAVNGATSSNDAESRKALAGDVLNIYNSLMDIANSNYMGRYIFGGFDTDKPPFSGGGNRVTGVISVSRNGGEASAKSVFEDIPELQSGGYTAKISVYNGVGMLSLYDAKGNAVMLDSDGGDESGDGGNKSSTVLTFDYKPGAVINTGRGVSFKLPETNETGLTLKFTYESGSEMSYAGDLGSILAKIGYNQDVAINMPGSEIFSQTYKTLQGSRLNTVNGMAATLATYFSQLDKSNGGLGDSIRISGTDHNGNSLGSASLLSPANSALDLTDASEKERTLRIGYGDKMYKLVVPQGSYAGMDELTAAINHELKNAEYLGSLNIPAGGLQDMDAYANYVANKIKNGSFPGEIPPASQNYSTDLSGEIHVSADGSRLQFSTSKTGDNVRLTITGEDGGMLGFKNNTLASEGKDTVFEVGYDFHKTQVEVVRNTHGDIDFSGNAVKFFINGTMISVPSSKSEETLNGQTFPGGAADPAYSINVKGKTVTVPAADLAGKTDADMLVVINRAIKNAGLGAEANVTYLDSTAHTLKIVTVQSQKELEFSLDKALRSAGLDFSVSASAEGSVPADFGHYNISFSLVNNNADRNTQLTTTWYDENTVPPGAIMLTAAPDRTDLNIAGEHTLGDFADFVKNLYDNSVDVSIKDGRLVVKDLRSGQSRMTVNLSSGNEGVGHPADQNTVMGGKYTGAFDNTWTVNVATELSRSGQRDVTIRIADKSGNIIYDKKTENYVGGGIQLPYGVTIDPNDMGLHSPLASNTAQFNINLKANSSVAFGDMNVVENGQNVNIFRALKNLEHALMYNITKNGFSEPSAWRDSTLSSTASPYFDGKFKGSFNDEWTYEILQNNGLNEAYLQNEYKQLSGGIRYDATAVANLGDAMSFGVDLYDNVSGENKRVNVNIDFSRAVPSITDAASARDYILQELNDNPDLRASGVRFTASNGKIEMQSGSGTKIASFASTATGREKALADYVMGFDVPANGKLADFPLTIVNPGTVFNLTDINSPGVADPSYPTTQITIPAGTYNTPEELLRDLNARLQAAGAAGGTDGRITASLDAWGGIKFSLRDGSEVTSTVTDVVNNPLNISTATDPAGRADVFSTAAQKAKTDLSEASDEARTLSFTYMAGVPPRSSKTAITLDKKAYSSEWELAKAINEKLDAQGIAVTDMKAILTSDGKLSFTGTSGRFQNMTAQGDYTGTLGFPKAGDQARIKVADSSGTVVQETTLESANKTVGISDGLNLGFGVGFLSATDSFTGAIGSGIENELGTLDQAQNQLLKAITAIGNRASRVESVTKFQETVKTAGENTKAGYLQSTELDQIKAMTELTQAKAAYETALTAAQTIMSISILDFLK